MKSDPAGRLEGLLFVIFYRRGLLSFVGCIFALQFAIASHADGEDIAPALLEARKSAAVHVESGIFRQQVRTNYGIEDGLPPGKVYQLAFDQKLLAATDQGIATLEMGRWRLTQPTDSPVTRIAVAANGLWFSSENQLFQMSGQGTPRFAGKLPPNTTVTALLATDGGLYVGSTKGLFSFAGSMLTPLETVNQLLRSGLEIRQLAASGGEVAVAASGGLISYLEKSKRAEVLVPRNARAGWALHDVRGVGFDFTGNLWFAEPQGVGRRDASGWSLYTGNDGLPYNDFTCLATGPDQDVWFGTRIGAIRFTGRQWEYRQGQRWLAHDTVSSLLVTPAGDAWLTTPAGITCIEARPITLREKAVEFNSEIDRYHRRTPYGYVDAIHLQKPGDKSNGVQYDSDNDGLWTSMYGAAQCFEYASTRSAESKRRANAAFRAVAFLSEVTQGGTHPAPWGFPARTIVPTSGRNPNDHDSQANDQKKQLRDPLWKVITPRWPVSADGKWYWKTDTSSDELDGHYFFYALYNDLVAETDEEKAAVRAVVDRVTSHLLDHDLALVDHDGKPTRWGQFNPKILNTDVLTDCRGLNSVSVLSYLVTAQHVTGDDKYRKKYEELLKDHNYFTNVLNPKYQNGPGSGNQSDDEMAFMCYYNLFSYEKDARLRQQYMRSFARYFAQEESEVCPLFNFIFASFYEPIPDHWNSVPVSLIEDSVETLQRYPLDRIHWGYKNSHRLDIVPLGHHIPESKGKGHLRNGKIIPIDERFVNHWNVDPWVLDDSSSGRQLADGSSYLLPYWMGVYHGFILDSQYKKSVK